MAEPVHVEHLQEIDTVPSVKDVMDKLAVGAGLIGVSGDSFFQSGEQCNSCSKSRLDNSLVRVVLNVKPSANDTLAQACFLPSYLPSETKTGGSCIFSVRGVKPTTLAPRVCTLRGKTSSSITTSTSASESQEQACADRCDGCRIYPQYSYGLDSQGRWVLSIESISDSSSHKRTLYLY